MSTAEQVDSAVQELLREFEERPIDFNVEVSVQARLSGLLRDKLDPVYASVGETRNEAPKALRAVVEKALDVEEVERVREEINTEIIDGNTDVGVLGEEDVIVEMTGSKRFKAEDLDVAIEIKFIKNATDYGDYRLISGNDHRIEKDLQRLSRFPDHVSKHFLLFANCDLFCQTADGDYTNELTRYNQSILRSTSRTGTSSEVRGPTQSAGGPTRPHQRYRPVPLPHRPHTGGPSPGAATVVGAASS